MSFFFIPLKSLGIVDIILKSCEGHDGIFLASRNHNAGKDN